MMMMDVLLRVFIISAQGWARRRRITPFLGEGGAQLPLVDCHWFKERNQSPVVCSRRLLVVGDCV